MVVAAVDVAGSTSQASAPNYIRVLVVDDSAVIRGILSRWLEDDPFIRVVSTAHNGLVALRQVKQQRFDVVVLDIEMPDMDGLTALPQILDAQPGIQVLMASTLTLRNADISLKAMSLGATDYIPKPQSTGIITNGIDFRRELLEKVKAIGQLARRKRGESLIDFDAPGAVKLPGGGATAPQTAVPTPVARPIARPAAAKLQLAKPSTARPAILAIGASTGGPQALFALLRALPRPFPLPIVVTQHMPPTFTKILAEHIQRQTSIPTDEAQHGELLKPGRIYVAPGGRHMTVAGTPADPTAALDDGPPENFCRPAVDPLFRTAAQVFGNRCLGVVLTGMGHDGRNGASEVVARGGTVIAQDEATSVVWGMPGAVAGAGLASFILPLDDIGTTIGAIMEGRRP